MTDLVGRTVQFQASRDADTVPATVLGARWSGTTVNGRAGIQFLLDLGDGPLVWSVAYPEPEEKE